MDFLTEAFVDRDLMRDTRVARTLTSVYTSAHRRLRAIAQRVRAIIDPPR
jgi:hypothetical protein